jgi:L-cysteine/cystine lyase
VTFEEARAAFPVLERFAYLNAGTFGPIARSTFEAMQSRERRDLEQGRGGGEYFEDMRTLRDRARELLARTLGVAPDGVALTGSTTEGCNIVLGGLELGPDDEIVTTDLEHFGLLGPLNASGARIRVAEIGTLEPERALDAMLALVGPRTRLVALSHVAWTTGNVLPLEELRDATEIPILVDGAQSAGAIPVDASRFDFYTVSAQKWLCGPDSTGALYVRDPDRLRVSRPSYFSQESYEMPGGAFVPRAGAARFDPGWLATPSLAGLVAAIEIAPEWRYARAAELAARCWSFLSERYQVVTAPGQATLVTFVPPQDPAETVQRLYERGVVVRDMPGRGWLRVSCGYWTSEEDIERLLAALV